jgi:hypothetical protein
MKKPKLSKTNITPSLHLKKKKEECEMRGLRKNVKCEDWLWETCKKGRVKDVNMIEVLHMHVGKSNIESC